MSLSCIWLDNVTSAFSHELKHFSAAILEASLQSLSLAADVASSKKRGEVINDWFRDTRLADEPRKQARTEKRICMSCIWHEPRRDPALRHGAKGERWVVTAFMPWLGQYKMPTP